MSEVLDKAKIVSNVNSQQDVSVMINKEIFENIIDVIWQNEVTLESTFDIRYIKSGEFEINRFVEQVIKPGLNSFSLEKKNEISDLAVLEKNLMIEDIQLYSNNEVKPELLDYAEKKIKPELQLYVDKTSANAQYCEEKATSAGSSFISAEKASAEARMEAKRAEMAAIQAEQVLENKLNVDLSNISADGLENLYQKSLADNTDFNNITDMGYYCLYVAENTNVHQPVVGSDAGSWFVKVMTTSSVIIQVAVAVNNLAGGYPSIYIRQRIGGVWKEWVDILTASLPDINVRVSRSIGTTYTATTSGWIYLDKNSATATELRIAGKLAWRSSAVNSATGFVPVAKGVSYKATGEAANYFFYSNLGGI